jgi:rhodanese-related sulfurtransferase
MEAYRIYSHQHAAAAPAAPITISSLRYMPRDELADRLLQQQQQQQQQRQQDHQPQPSTPDPSAAATTPTPTPTPAPAPAATPALVVVDVRDDDYAGGHVRGGIRAPSATLDHALPELARRLRGAHTVVFHCALSQQRGPAAALRYARERARMGFDRAAAGAAREGEGEATAEEEAVKQEIFVLEGGFVKWQEK